MKLVFLDCAGVNPGDLSWAPLEKLGELKYYKKTEKEERLARMKGAEAVFVDSLPLEGSLLKQCPELKFIGIAATGYNHVDLETAEELGIGVANVPAYSTDAVAQQTIALLLSISNRVETFRQAVFAGEWRSHPEEIPFKTPVKLLAGKSIGIVGYGNIGKKVAEIARAFGMTVNVYSQDPQAALRSDVVSLHCPLTRENQGMADREFFAKMKEGAIFLNTARGGLVDEQALADALNSGKLLAAGLDVLRQEPPQEDHPLVGLENCWITPHIGFIPPETRKTVIDVCAANLESFRKGEKLNRLV